MCYMYVLYITENPHFLCPIKKKLKCIEFDQWRVKMLNYLFNVYNKTHYAGHVIKVYFIMAGYFWYYTCILLNGFMYQCFDK